MEMREYLRLMRRAWALLVVLGVLGALGGVAYERLQAPRYASSARAFVSVTSASTLTDLTTGVTAAQQAASGYAAVATTAYVLRPVISGLGLDTTSAALAARLEVVVPDDSQVVHVTATDETPQGAARIANAVVQQLTTASINPGSRTGSVEITPIDPAVAVETPVGPGPVVPIVVGGLLGLLLASMLAALRGAVDTRVRTREDLERVSAVPLLGTTPRDGSIGKRPLVVGSGSTRAAAEAYRTLRTNLRFVELDPAASSLVITSAVQGEGKSVTAANTALAMAGLGRKVLLVDADLRRPRVATTFGIDGTIGLSDVLVGQIAVEDAVQAFGDSGLHLLPAGTIPPNPNEQLQSQSMRRLVERLHAEYDLVLFDTPPLLPVSDAVVLSAQAGAVLVVAASGRVRRPQLADALGRLGRADARTAGLVLTMVPRREPEGRTEAYEYGPRTEKPRGRTRTRPAKRSVPAVPVAPEPSVEPATQEVESELERLKELQAPAAPASGPLSIMPYSAGSNPDIQPGAAASTAGVETPISRPDSLRDFIRPELWERAAALPSVEEGEPSPVPHQKEGVPAAAALEAAPFLTRPSEDTASDEVADADVEEVPARHATQTASPAHRHFWSRRRDPGHRAAVPVRIPPPPGVPTRAQQRHLDH